MAATHQHDTQDALAIFVHGQQIRRAMESAADQVRCTSSRQLRLFQDPNEFEGKVSEAYFVLSFLDLTANERMIKTLKDMNVQHKRFLVFTEQVGPESISEITAMLNVRSPEKIHTPRLELDDLRSFCRRFVGSLCATDSHQAIMDVWWEGDTFVVKSATFQRIKVPAKQLPKKLQNASEAERKRLEIDEDGDQVYWPKFDIHMGWSQFQQAVDPQARLRAEQKSKDFNIAYGNAIRVLRERHGIKQQDVAGLDERTVRRIEHGQTRATANALANLAEAHGLSTSAYMNEIAKILRPNRPKG